LDRQTQTDRHNDANNRFSQFCEHACKLRHHAVFNVGSVVIASQRLIPKTRTLDISCPETLNLTQYTIFFYCKDTTIQKSMGDTWCGYKIAGLNFLNKKCSNVSLVIL